MTAEQLRAIIVEEIGNIAPEVDAASVKDDADLREALDLDSMDIFNLVIALSQRLKIDIPEVDAPRLVTLGSGTAYLEARAAGK
jgi:acyl carrier protein